MSVKINKKALYVRSDDTDQAVWKELPCIQGRDGLDAYKDWCHRNGKEETDETWIEFLNVLGGTPGASRVSFNENNLDEGFTLYTPTPTTASYTYEGNWGAPTSIKLPLGAKYQRVEFKSISGNPKTPIIFGSTAAATGDNFSAADFNEDIRYRLPQGIHIGNGSDTLPNYNINNTAASASKYGGAVEQGYFIDTFLGVQPTNASNIDAVYSAPRTVNALTIDKRYGDLCIGGGDNDAASSANIPLGQTIIKAGMASYTGNRYNMGTTIENNSYKKTSGVYNGIIARRKYDINSSWKDYMMLDSGHMEMIHIEMDTSSGGFIGMTTGHTYTANVTLANTYKNIPYVFTNVYNWNPDDKSQDWRSFFKIDTVWLTTAKNKLQVRIYYKKTVVGQITSNGGFAPHIGILVVSADNNTPFIANSLHTSNRKIFPES